MKGQRFEDFTAKAALFPQIGLQRVFRRIAVSEKEFKEHILANLDLRNPVLARSYALDNAITLTTGQI